MKLYKVIILSIIVTGLLTFGFTVGVATHKKATKTVLDNIEKECHDRNKNMIIMPMERDKYKVWCK